MLVSGRFNYKLTALFVILFAMLQLSIFYFWSDFKLLLLDSHLALAKKSTKNYGFFSEIQTPISPLFNVYNAAYYEAVGDLALYNPKRDEEINRKRINLYINAINNQPAKAQFWLKLAHAKVSEYEFDDIFYEAYEKAFIYGGNEYFINESLARIGLAYWYSMKVDTRVLIKSVINRLYLENPYQTLILARSYGQMRMACIWVEDIGNINPMCEAEFRKNFRGHNYR